MIQSKIKNIFKFVFEEIKPYFSGQQDIKSNKIQEMSNLYLLNGETIIILKAKNDTKAFNIKHAIPLIYHNQIPIYFNIIENKSNKIENYIIYDDKNAPNKLLNIKISSMKKNESITLHFFYSVLVKNNNYKDLPVYKKIPNENELQEDIKKWLTPTKSIQANNIFLKLKALFLKPRNKNLIALTKRTCFFSCYHRLFLGLLRKYIEETPILHNLFLPRKYWTGLNDAISYHFLGGLCGGKANYETALLRCNNIPTRVLTTTTMYYGEKKWIDAQHFIIEFYCPDYGWITAMSGRMPYQPKNFIILRINYPEDENIAGNGLSYYGGTLPWFWIDNPNIDIDFPEKYISYKRMKGSGVPAVCGWIEKKITVNDAIAEEILTLTKKAWEMNMQYLSKVNKEKIFKEGQQIQKKIIEYFKQSDIEKCIEQLHFLLKNQD